MKIYIAGSWKEERMCNNIAHLLLEKGHKVDCFCGYFTTRYQFNFSEIADAGEIDQFKMMKSEQCIKAYKEDKKWLDWADCVILVLPSGRSAHLEAGYMKGKGGLLFIIGSFPKGEGDVMYKLADGIYRFNQFPTLARRLKRLDK